MTELAIFDLDGTIVKIPERKDNEFFSWDSFLDLMDTSTVIEDVLKEQVIAHLNKLKVVVVSARPESSRARTESLLRRVGFVAHEIILRSDLGCEQEAVQLRGLEDTDKIMRVMHNNHAEWREGVARMFYERGDTMSVAFDDQHANLDTWRSWGATTWFIDADGIMTLS